jgi:transcriptional regulator with XRE-family HTH domain
MELGEAQTALAARISHLRRQAGWTNEELADRSGLSPRTITALQTPYANPTFITLLVLADTFGVTLSDLLGDNL